MFDKSNSLSVIDLMNFKQLNHKTNRLKESAYGVLFYVNNVLHREDFNNKQERSIFIKRIIKHNKVSDDYRSEFKKNNASYLIEL